MEPSVLPPKDFSSLQQARQFSVLRSILGMSSNE
jgi:hypothetical protein